CSVRQQSSHVDTRAQLVDLITGHGSALLSERYVHTIRPCLALEHLLTLRDDEVYSSIFATSDVPEEPDDRVHPVRSRSQLIVSHSTKKLVVRHRAVEQRVTLQKEVGEVHVSSYKNRVAERLCARQPQTDAHNDVTFT